MKGKIVYKVKKLVFQLRHSLMYQKIKILQKVNLLHHINKYHKELNHFKYLKIIKILIKGEKKLTNA